MSDGARIIITHTIGAGELAAEIAPAMQRLVNAIHRRAQRLVPKRTWNLHDTLVNGVEVQGGRVVGAVGVGGSTGAAPDGAGYWDFVEHGTSRMRAQPYLRPALLQSRSADLDETREPSAPRGGRS
jgi:HK97 gp10 family phage protein